MLKGDEKIVFESLCGKNGKISVDYLPTLLRLCKHFPTESEIIKYSKMLEPTIEKEPKKKEELSIKEEKKITFSDFEKVLKMHRKREKEIKIDLEELGNKLFNCLDKNNTGKIKIKDLESVLVNENLSENEFRNPIKFYFGDKEEIERKELLMFLNKEEMDC